MSNYDAIILVIMAAGVGLGVSVKSYGLAAWTFCMFIANLMVSLK